MSYYFNTETGVREIDAELYASWVAAGNPKAGYWTPIPDPPSPYAQWDGQQWVDQYDPKQALIDSIVTRTQARLDAFAGTRGYDSCMSACTYATSPTPKFATEGQYCVTQRDATWATLYAILDEVEAGIRPAPTGYADIEPDLPALIWPEA